MIVGVIDSWYMYSIHCLHSVVTYQLQCSHPGFHWIQLQDTDGAVNNEVHNLINSEEVGHDFHTMRNYHMCHMIFADTEG